MELMPLTLSVVVPCYNEADNIDKLYDEMLPVLEMLIAGKFAAAPVIASVELLLVDDGSKDGTYNALKGRFSDIETSWLTVHILQHTTNQGLGAALRTGFQAANGDLVITTDSDGTYRFEEIPNLLACLIYPADIVTASPYHPDGGVMNVPGYRLILSRGSSFLYRLLVDWKVHTYTALFRVYRCEVVKGISFQSNGFLAGTELMVNAMLQGYQVAEYPTILHSRQNGVSKAKIMRTIRAHLRFQGEILLRRLGFRSNQLESQPQVSEVRA